MGKGQVILGETVDFITGQTLPDTLDERIRQQIARFLVEEKGYAKQDIETRIPLSVTVDNSTGTAVVDFRIRIQKKSVMILMFGPGSIVTRQRAALAAARLLEDYAVPYAVITNGKDAQFMDTASGKSLGEGLNAIISKKNILEEFGRLAFEEIPQNRREKEARILFALDILSRRECNECACAT